MRTYTCDRCGANNVGVYGLFYQPSLDYREYVPINLDLCQKCIQEVVEVIKMDPTGTPPAPPATSAQGLTACGTGVIVNAMLKGLRGRVLSNFPPKQFGLLSAKNNRRSNDGSARTTLSARNTGGFILYSKYGTVRPGRIHSSDIA